MRFLRPAFVLSSLTSLCLVPSLVAQASTATNANGLNPAPIAQPGSPNAVDRASVAAAPLTATATAAPAMDAKAAVQSILTMFTLNQAVMLADTGKPLPATGAWGAQTQFPAGMPKVCLMNQVPCVKVIYRVPEAKVSCEWTLGLLVAAEPQADGTIKHAVHQIVLDENDAAARYTLRKAWGRGEKSPRPTFTQRADYPAIARAAGVGGVVTVRLIVGPDGTVKSAVPLGGPAMLRPAVVDAVSHWKYEPLLIGQQPTSFQVDHQFSYNAGKADTFAGMDPAGQVVLQQNDPHLDPGFHSDGASSGSWANCSAASGCTQASPSVPK